jgi:hypothetical protein
MRKNLDPATSTSTPKSQGQEHSRGISLKNKRKRRECQGENQLLDDDKDKRIHIITSVAVQLALNSPSSFKKIRF